MNKRLNFIITGLLVTSICFSLFSIGFAFSAVDGTSHNVTTLMNSVPINLIEVCLSLKKANSMHKNFIKHFIDPFDVSLITADELSPNGFAVENPNDFVAPVNINKHCNPITEKDVNLIKKSPYVKDAFICNPFIDKIYNNRLVTNRLQLSIFYFPWKFFKEIGFPLLYGRYFTAKDSVNSIIITYELSHFLFGNTNSVGKIIKSSGTSYKVVGVLKPLSKEEKSLLPNLIFSTNVFGPLPTNYVPGKDVITPQKPPNADLMNILWIIPNKGESLKAINFIKKTFEHRNTDEITLTINSSFQKAKYAFSTRVVMNNIKFITYAALFVLLLSIIVFVEFVILGIDRRKKSISMKRSLGATKSQIFKEEYLKYAVISLIAEIITLFSLIVILKSVNNINLAGMASLLRVNSYILSKNTAFRIGKTTISVTLLSTIFAVSVSLLVTLPNILKKPPAIIALPKTHSNNKTNVSLIRLALILIVVISGIFTLLSIRYTISRKLYNLESELSPNTIRISPQELDFINSPIQDGYTFKDYLSIKTQFSKSAYIGYRRVPPYEIQIPNKNHKVALIRISQSTEEFPEIYGFTLEKGRFLKDNDHNVCVIGSKVSKLLNLDLGDYYKGDRVIGIIANSNSLINRTIFVSNNNPLFSRKQSLLYGNFLVKSKNGKLSGSFKIAKEIVSFLDKKHNLIKGHIINVSKNLMLIKNASTSLYTLLSIFTFLAFLSSFLSLSALLFIEVIRKTREIGIKKAIGATRREITKEFTLKGLKTTVIALIIGIPIGILISLIIEKLKGWNYYIPINILILVIFISLLLGFVFSFLPAYFASKTNPVEAIKSE